MRVMFVCARPHLARYNLYPLVYLMPWLGRGTRNYYTLMYGCNYGEVVMVDGNNNLQTVRPPERGRRPGNDASF